MTIRLPRTMLKKKKVISVLLAQGVSLRIV